MGGLRLQVLAELHATPFGGHFGRDKTLALARRSVWWPGLPATVEEHIRSCPICQRVKADHLPPAGLLYPLPVLTRRGGSISLDFIALPVAQSGHDFLQVHIDLLTGRVWLVPTFKTATAETAARNFVTSVFRDMGLPDRPGRARLGPRHALHECVLGLACTRPSARRLSSDRSITRTPPAKSSA